MRITSPTPDRIAEFKALRDAGYSIRAISEKTSFSYSTVSKYLRQTAADKKCPKRGQALPPQARFCFACGSKILTQRESVIEQLSDIRGAFTLVPSNARDSFIAAINGAISYLEGLPDE